MGTYFYRHSIINAAQNSKIMHLFKSILAYVLHSELLILFIFAAYT